MTDTGQACSGSVESGEASAAKRCELDRRRSRPAHRSWPRAPADVHTAAASPRPELRAPGRISGDLRKDGYAAAAQECRKLAGRRGPQLHQLHTPPPPPERRPPRRSERIVAWRASPSTTHEFARTLHLGGLTQSGT